MDVKIKEDPFSKEEYKKIKETLTEGKACDEDGTSPEVLKRWELEDIILDFCNNALMQEEIPSQWTILNIIPITNTGDLSLGGSYSRISWSSLVAKAFNKVILNQQLIIDSVSTTMVFVATEQQQVTFLICEDS